MLETLIASTLYMQAAVLTPPTPPYEIAANPITIATPNAAYARPTPTTITTTTRPTVTPHR
jgi:hypothetical protein